MNQKGLPVRQAGFAPILIVVLVAIVTSVGGYFVYQQFQTTPTSLTQKACTQEAKLCPDGSAVGRSGPNCEFTPCPTPSNPTASSSSQTTDNSKSCSTDNDCSLLACSGCFNKEWLKSAPVDLPCVRYNHNEYSCKCVSNSCSVTK